MTNLPPLRDVIAEHGLRAKKSLGQNFILDQNLTDRIALAAGALEDCPVLEVGPGPGGLTRSLLRLGARSVIAIEKDERCLAALDDVAAAFPNRLHVVEADALKINEADLLLERQIADVRVIANLPYNVGSKLLIKWLLVAQWPPWFRSLSLLFQKEVAERIVAVPGTKAYGRLSVMANWRCVTRIAFDIPPRAFTPPPKVTSSLVVLTPSVDVRAQFAPTDLEAVVAAAFSQRRKMVKASLRQLGVPTDQLLKDADIDPSIRAENIDVAGYCRLTEAYCRARDNMQNSA